MTLARAVGAVVAGVLAAALIRVALQPGVDEWNPAPIRAGALLGAWTDGSRTLALRGDSTFALRAAGTEIAVGRYHRRDWNLALVDTVGRTTQAWRVVEARGEYRIIRNPEEPDVWDGDLGFRRVPSARVP